MNKALLKKKRFWFSLAAIGASVATQTVDQGTIAAVGELFSLFGG